MKIQFTDILMDLKNTTSAVAFELNLSHHDKEDVMQDTLLYAWLTCQSKENFTGHEHAVKYFTRKAKCIAFDMFRKHRKYDTMPDELLPDVSCEDDFDFVFLKMNDEEENIVALIMSGYSQREMADQLGVSFATMSRKVKRLMDLARFACDEQSHQNLH